MDFTNPFVNMQRVKMTDEELAQALRLDMAAELDAISLYQAHLDATDNPVGQRLIKHIMDEEKEHLEEFAQLLYYLDPTQAAAVHNARVEFAESGLPPANICAPPAAETPQAMQATLTVGSLKE